VQQVYRTQYDRTALFCVVTRRVVVISHRRYGPTYRVPPSGVKNPNYLLDSCPRPFGTPCRPHLKKNPNPFGFYTRRYAPTYRVPPSGVKNPNYFWILVQESNLFLDSCPRPFGTPCRPHLKNNPNPFGFYTRRYGPAYRAPPSGVKNPNYFLDSCPRTFGTPCRPHLKKNPNPFGFYTRHYGPTYRVPPSGVKNRNYFWILAPNFRDTLSTPS